MMTMKTSHLKRKSVISSVLFTPTPLIECQYFERRTVHCVVLKFSASQRLGNYRFVFVRILTRGLSCKSNAKLCLFSAETNSGVYYNSA